MEGHLYIAAGMGMTSQVVNGLRKRELLIMDEAAIWFFENSG
jgi:hypothetical protein